MGQFILDVPAGAQTTRAVDGLAGYFGYEATISSGGSQIANPETKPTFIKRKLAEVIKGMVLSYEAGQASKAATDTVTSSASALTIS